MSDNQSSQRTKRGPIDAAKGRYEYEKGDILRDHDELLWRVSSRLYDHDVTDPREDSWPDGRDRRKYELVLAGSLGGTTRTHSESDVMMHYDRVPEDQHPETYAEVEDQPDLHRRLSTWSVTEYMDVHEPEDVLALAGLLDDRLGLPAKIQVKATKHQQQFINDTDDDE